MGYRDFVKPDFIYRTHRASDWLRWLEREAVLYDAAPRPNNSCELCGGAVGLNWSGRPFSHCPQCRNYISLLQGLVSVTYSFDDGLESMLHRYKDFGPEWRWLELPLRSLLWSFCSEHAGCIVDAYGPFDIYVTVPGDSAARQFDHLAGILQPIGEAPFFPWRTDLISRVTGVPRPSRTEVKPEAYRVSPIVEKGARVLVFDDTWTSGASIVSLAAALREAGASSVAALTLGRQLNSQSTYLNNQELVEEVRKRAWGPGCVLCS